MSHSNEESASCQGKPGPLTDRGGGCPGELGFAEEGRGVFGRDRVDVEADPHSNPATLERRGMTSMCQ